MRLSIIIAILNSHEIVRRQLLHFKKMDLPDDIEIIFMDDGSDPPLADFDPKLKNLTILPTNDFRPWTTSIARNSGARLAKADWILMTDIDHILVRETIMAGREFTGDRMTYRREFGVLDESGNFNQDVPTLLSYGLLPERIRRKGLRAPPHGNSFVMRKELFWKAGGYRVTDMGEKYPPMDESHFRGAYRALMQSGQATTIADDLRPKIYLIPNGYYCGDPDYNPFGLFHGLSRSKWGHSKRFMEQTAKIAEGKR